MFAIRKIGQVASQATLQTVISRSVISGPPKNRISFAEKTVHGIIIAIGVSVTPIWVLQHLREYRGIES